ncbi:hypothetical protein Esi_0313_0030 [Ectocarpus siliculosus]|uniref:Uncharacterized protein n=1 Tax=Ectocarpus siliculosus TaxID=2880 RepID=D7FWU6_ECTSI|nr:hypothetical protein Esi_0313_0030 [Ectocarpus siliculosus]|eukprot:CBJ32184.1 hypothetical protein Esi_0313_0030 [Ectocarpus siliculosus]
MASMFGSFPGMFNAAAFAAAAAAAFPAGAKGLPKLAPVAPAAAAAASPAVLCLAPKTTAAAAGKPPPGKRRKRGRNEDGDAPETGGATAAADAVKLEEVNGAAGGPLPAGRIAGREQQAISPQQVASLGAAGMGGVAGGGGAPPLPISVLAPSSFDGDMSTQERKV